MEASITRQNTTEQSQINVSKKDDLDEIIKAKEQNERQSEINSRIIEYNLNKHQNTKKK